MAEQRSTHRQEKTGNWLRQFMPQPTTARRSEQLRAGAGALFGLLLTALLTPLLVRALAGNTSAMVFLIAPMGASAVLLFGVPASPLAQPWSVFGGNLVSAIVGVTVARLVADPVWAAPIAAGAAIVSMFALRCLHPPGGAVALTAVLAGPAVHAAGYQFAYVQVALNSALMVAAALLYNNLTGRRYPHSQQSTLKPAAGAAVQAPVGGIGFAARDLDVVLQRYGQVLDISRDDLEKIILATEVQAYERRFGIITCGDIMTAVPVALEFATPLGEAWSLMREHGLHALPVLNKARRVIGMVAQSDFLGHAAQGESSGFAARLRRFLMPYDGSHSDKPEVVGQIMTPKPQTARRDTPIAELVPVLSNGVLQSMPVVDHEDRLAGMVNQADLLRAIFQQTRAEAV